MTLQELSNLKIGDRILHTDGVEGTITSTTIWGRVQITWDDRPLLPMWRWRLPWGELIGWKKSDY